MDLGDKSGSGEIVENAAALIQWEMMIVQIGVVAVKMERSRINIDLGVEVRCHSDVLVVEGEEKEGISNDI